MSEQLQNQRPALRRSSTDRMIGGVCGGIARTLGVDTVIVRVIVAVLGILGGAGFAAYVIAWILIPNDDGTTALQRSDGRRRAGQWFLIVLLAISVASLVDDWFPGSNNGVGFLVFLGIAGLLWQSFGSDWYRRTTVTHSPDATASGFQVQQDGNTATIATPLGSVSVSQERKSPLGRIVWNAIVAATGVMIAMNWADITNISARAIIIVDLAIVGVGLLISAFVGRARGLIVIGIALSLLLMIPQDVNVESGTGNRTWLPTSTAEATSGVYDLGVGDATLDLRTLDAVADTATVLTVRAHVGAGNLIVLIPSTSAHLYDITASVSVGEIVLPDRPRESGVNHTRSTTLGSSAGSIIHLDLSTHVGNLEVRYA